MDSKSELEIPYAKIMLLSILGLGAFLRFYQLSFGLGTHPDERHMAMVTEHLTWADPNPHSFAYGSFSFYLVWVVSEALGLLWPWLTSYDGIFYVGRSVCALLGVLSIFLTYILARQLYQNTITALAAAALLSFNFFHIQLSRYFTSDVILTTLCLSALCSMVQFRKTQKLRFLILLAIFFGLACATKISAIFLSIPIAIAVGTALFCEPRLSALRVFASLGIVLLIAAITAFFAAPYELLDFETFWKHTTEQTNMVRGVWRPPYTIQYEGTIPYLYHLKQMFFYTLGWPVALAAALGFCLAIKRNLRAPIPEELIVVAWVLVFFIATGGFQVKFPRYLLPIYPELMVFAGFGLLSIKNFFRASNESRTYDQSNYSRRMPEFTSFRGVPLSARVSFPLLLLVITVLGAVLRLVSLTDLPFGLHGDEAWTGIDAREVLRRGWIGVYVPSALGQPAGPLYWVALVFALFGDTLFNLRLSIAVLGIGAIPLLYFLGKKLFDEKVGFLAAFLLSVDLWHLHYSRIAFMVTAWPLWQTLVLILVLSYLKSGAWRDAAFAGASFGFGFYMYNAFPTSAVAALLVLLIGFIGRSRWGFKINFKSFVVFVLAVALSLVPLLVTFVQEPGLVFSRHAGLFASAAETGFVSQLLQNFGTVLSSLFWSSHPDGTDAAGIIPMFSFWQVAILLVGGAVVLKKYTNFSAWVLGCLLLLLPLGSVLTTTSHGLFRRSFGLSPVLCLLMAQGVLCISGWASKFHPKAGRVLVLVLPLLLGARTLWFYFERFPSEGLTKFVFCQELRAVADYVVQLPKATWVNFYSGRWSMHYETLRFLAPELQGQDLAKEFQHGSPENIPTPGAPQVNILLEPYLTGPERPAWTSRSNPQYQHHGPDGSVWFTVYPANDVKLNAAK